MKCEILYEDPEILVIRKPAGLATQTASVTQPDAVSELKGYLAKTGAGQSAGQTIGAGQTAGAGQSKPRGKGGRSDPYVGIVHRLDQPVEGLLVFAKTPKAAAELTRQLGSGALNKRYYALVCGRPVQREGVLEDFLWKDETNTARVVTGREEEYPQAKRARLTYEIIGELSGETFAKPFEGAVSFLDIRIETGRFHQIRAQLSHAGWPILGDRKYGGEEAVRTGALFQLKSVALCAYQLEIRHPATGRKMSWKILPEAKAFTILKP